MNIDVLSKPVCPVARFQELCRPQTAQFGPSIGERSGAGGIALQLDKTAQPPGALICYVYLLADAQLNISDGRLISTAL